MHPEISKRPKPKTNRPSQVNEPKQLVGEGGMPHPFETQAPPMGALDTSEDFTTVLCQAKLFSGGRLQIELVPIDNKQEALFPNTEQARLGLLRYSALYHKCNTVGVRRILTINVYKPWKTEKQRLAEEEAFRRMETEAKNLSLRSIPGTKLGEMA